MDQFQFSPLFLRSSPPSLGPTATDFFFFFAIFASHTRAQGGPKGRVFVCRAIDHIFSRGIINLRTRTRGGRAALLRGPRRTRDRAAATPGLPPSPCYQFSCPLVTRREEEAEEEFSFLRRPSITTNERANNQEEREGGNPFFQPASS